LKDGGSHRNLYEADIVAEHIQLLVKSNISPSQIGVITPYNGQLELLRNLLAAKYPALEIRLNHFPYQRHLNYEDN
jgi:superfamily I DNA and/or RNA helicase